MSDFICPPYVSQPGCLAEWGGTLNTTPPSTTTTSTTASTTTTTEAPAVEPSPVVDGTTRTTLEPQVTVCQPEAQESDCVQIGEPLVIEAEAEVLTETVVAEPATPVAVRHDQLAYTGNGEAAFYGGSLLLLGMMFCIFSWIWKLTDD